jgi:hypothetical protein
VGGLSETNLHTCLAAGFGPEVGLTNTWSVKAEGLLNDYGNRPSVPTHQEPNFPRMVEVAVAHL